MDRMKMHASFRRESAARLSLWVAALILICLALCTSNASAQRLPPIGYSDTTFTEPVDADFWKRYPRGKSIDIHSPIRPASVTFHWPVFFNRSRFNLTADFRFSIFSSWAEFRYATFHSAAIFYNSKFNAEAGFMDVTFDSTAGFAGVDFNSRVAFYSADFNSEADFIHASFGSFASFSRARFAGPVRFDEAILPDRLDFRWVRVIDRVIDFTSSFPPLSGDKCLIALTGTDISKIKLRMGLFKLWFPNEPHPRVRVDGADTLVDTLMGPTYDQKASVYESVLKKLKDDGFTESYEILDIEYRRFKAEH